MNVATNVPRVNWLTRSRMKLRSNRGPNCDEASCKATIVIENVRLAIVIIEPATAPSSCREPSGPRTTVQGIAANQLYSPKARSIESIRAARRIDPKSIRLGTNQKFVRKESHLLNSQVFIDTLNLGELRR